MEPNPGLSANVVPQRYQSHGLRFDLRRKGESLDTFKKRVNAAEREDPKRGPRIEADDNRWLLGPDSISAGSIHCDVWSGPAIELLGRDTLCIKPVNGWWRDRAGKEYVNKQTRYALIVTLKAASVDVDLYTSIKAVVGYPRNGGRNADLIASIKLAHCSAKAGADGAGTLDAMRLDAWDPTSRPGWMQRDTQAEC